MVRRKNKVNNIVISKLIETNNSSKYLNGYLDDVIQSFVFILPKMSEYVKAFKEKNNKLMSFRIDYDKQLEKHNQLN